MANLVVDSKMRGKYHKLTPIRQTHIRRNKFIIWWFICDCGEYVLFPMCRVNKKNTKYKSCGCLKRKHGYASNWKEKRVKEYVAWIEMKRRCLNKSCKDYKFYGGRGIKVCERWLNNFSRFLKDVGLAPDKNYSIDRINNDGNYEPNNVRWATKKQQNNNKLYRRF